MFLLPPFNCSKSNFAKSKSKSKMQIKYTKEKNEIALKRTHVTKHKADDVKMMMTMPLLDGWCTVS